ncbi:MULTISPECIES: hypothetical protein [unclassified Pseudovibrio]|uniref:hypothetical protein n=1 Tax=unclassified Pseudovibrio TaxID=2627060 RepID=UPI0007AE750D|nr:MULTISPECIES: hypothetical protein [unclassified Pseudovibrio]KZL01861.1 hypothetical protein PsW74_01764 [Pseudovibrio sp. W74]KZL02977.1 hypothetical protein PsAD14_05762 [Pseudovibrio sp. Ad14]
MIMGFAHLMVNTGELLKSELEWGKQGYKRTALLQDVYNHPSKKAFSANYTDRHDLMLLGGTGLWPLELTYHGVVQGSNRQVTWHQDRIQIEMDDTTILKRLLVKGLGFKANRDNEFQLSPMLPDWACRICTLNKFTEPTRLDAAGASGLAFYSRRIEADSEKLKSLGAIEVSEIFELVLNDKKLDIALMRVPDGPLIELIRPQQPRKGAKS